jgi:hypothetical protein
MSLTARTDDRKSSPAFVALVPIRKTRSGLQFTCAAPTATAAAVITNAVLGNAANLARDVWVCNSDGYVGQVIIDNRRRQCAAIIKGQLVTFCQESDYPKLITEHFYQFMNLSALVKDS